MQRPFGPELHKLLIYYYPSFYLPSFLAIHPLGLASTLMDPMLTTLDLMEYGLDCSSDLMEGEVA